MNFIRKASFLSLICLSVFSAGCSEKRDEVQVTGEVTINGKPIPEGTINFVAADGIAQTGGGPIKDGKYTAFVLPGSKKVLVYGNEKVGEEPEYKGEANSPMRPIYKTLTPEKYNAAHLTDLTAEITGPQDGVNFELTGTPRN